MLGRPRVVEPRYALETNHVCGALKSYEQFEVIRERKKLRNAFTRLREQQEIVYMLNLMTTK